jgi:asparagine synthase (glutamine-hydrolysing)
MSHGFLLAIRRPGSSTWLPGHLEKMTGLKVTLERPGFVLLTAPGTESVALGEEGVVVGTVFPKHGSARGMARFDEADAVGIVHTNGRKLLADFWGGYAALIANAGLLLLRDPSGALPCYLDRQVDGLLVASSVNLLLAAGSRGVSVDWDSLAVHLYSAGLPRPPTVLAGIYELLPGFCLDPFGPVGSQRSCWIPWDHVDDNAGRDEARTAERLRRTVRHCLSSLVSPFRRVLVSVSGGLDSSIVAACLAGVDGLEVHCLTMFGDDPGGDEREYGRALCHALGLPLIDAATGSRMSTSMRRLARICRDPSGVPSHLLMKPRILRRRPGSVPTPS